MKDDTVGILIILGIIAIALFGGVKGAGNNGLSPTGAQTPEQKQQGQTNNTEQKIEEAQNEVDSLKIKAQAEENKKSQSKYKGIITLAYVNRSTDPTREYVTIRMNYNATETILVTGWMLRSASGGWSTTIPKGTYLFFAGIANVEENIYLTSGDTLYLVTGISPNGASFKVNKCSGYLGQFQTFIPYLNSRCPLPRYEDLSSIPKTKINDACFEYIESMQQCRIQTESTPASWSTECQNFIYNKINYPSCVNTHKNDKDFYGNEWMVYLKRSESMWKDRRENIVLYDNEGKIVDSLSY